MTRQRTKQHPVPEFPPDAGTTWADVAQRFPEAVVEWDVQGGPAWLAERPAATIVLHGDTLAVGCGDRKPFGWALWNAEHRIWMFM